MAFVKQTIALALGLAASNFAWQAPDTTALAKSFRILEREKAKPTVWEPIQKSPAQLKIRLIWNGDSIMEVRYVQTKPFSDIDMMTLAAEFGAGGSWHELPDPLPQSPEAKAYPGIVQQWQLEGFGGTLGWSGAGVMGDQFFLVFRKHSLTPVAPASEALDVRGDFFACQDTLSGWMKEKCPTGWPGLPPNAICFTPTDNPRRHVAVFPKSKVKATHQWMTLWQDPDPLSDISQAMKQLPDGSESAYAEDLSRILGGESIMILSRLAGLNPCLLNQPSWAIARLKTGHLKPKEYASYLGKDGRTWDWLPGLDLTLPSSIIKVDISLGGTYRISALPKK